jgi:hypothetical protein
MELARLRESVGGSMHPVLMSIIQNATNYVMRIATSITGADYLYYEKLTGQINTAKTTVVETILKCETSGSAGGQSLAVRNGARQASLNIYTGKIVCNDGSTNPYTYTVNTTTAYNKYRIELEGTSQAKFYMGETLIQTAPYANLRTTANNSIFFGDGVSTANSGGSCLWKSIKYNIDYVASPDNFIEWTASFGLPTENGWTAGGTASLATLIEE